MAVTIRQPATANLMVDSKDRSSGTFSNFTITRPNSILNGFFNRIGTTEVVLEWNTPNIGTFYGDTITITVVGDVGSPHTLTIPEGFYTVSQAFAVLVEELNALAIAGQTWTFTQTTPGVYSLASGDSDFAIANTPLAVKMDLYHPEYDALPARPVYSPDLRPYRYLDFISRTLTYNQDLKDASTALNVRDVLCRWYFTWDTPPTLDADDFPIYMGYTQFAVRRTFSPPKQIRWDNIQPVGQLSFEIYDDTGNLLNPTIDGFKNNFLMTLQVSEN